MSEKGWIPLDRKILDNWLWENKPFAYGQAWIDILMRANHKAKKIPFDGKVITVEKGCFITSESKLAERWGWNRSKVGRFLKLLESDNMIERETNNKRTAVRVLNYAVYNDFFSESEQPVNSQRTASEHKQQLNNENNVTMTNNENNENNGTREQNDLETKVSSCILDAQTKEEIITRWNELEYFGVTSIRGIDGKRLDAVRARMKQYGKDCFFDAIDRIRESNFLQGRNDRGWTITFDWLIKPNNFPKVIEGNYNKKKNKPINQTAQELNDFYEMSSNWAESEDKE